MPAPMLQVGQITVIPLSDTTFAFPPAGFMPDVPIEHWSDVKECLNEEGNVPLNVGCFLIREGDTLSLVDTGLGPRGAGGFPVGKLLDEMQKARVTPEQIQRVIITHLHVDHIGWNTRDKDGKPEIVFKNARHIVQRKDWDYWTHADIKQDNPVIALCAEPVHAAGLLDLVDGDATISTGISTIFTPGHTPGHQSVLVSSGGEKAVITGDVTHTPAQLVHPEWCPGFDIDPEVSRRSRKALFDRIEQEGLKVAAGHYPYPSIGNIVTVNGQRRWQGVGQPAKV